MEERRDLSHREIMKRIGAAVRGTPLSRRSNFSADTPRFVRKQGTRFARRRRRARRVGARDRRVLCDGMRRDATR